MQILKAVTALGFALAANQAIAQTEITFWHAMGGELGETTNQIAEKFNASQNDYRIVPIFKGTYEEAPSVRVNSPTSCRCSMPGQQQ